MINISICKIFELKMTSGEKVAAAGAAGVGAGILGKHAYDKDVAKKTAEALKGLKDKVIKKSDEKEGMVPSGEFLKGPVD